MSLDKFTDAELVKELARRKAEQIRLERQERENRSLFLFNNLRELKSLVEFSGRQEDERLEDFLREVTRNDYWDYDYDVELRLVKYPSLD